MSVLTTQCAYGVFTCEECGRHFADELTPLPEVVDAMDAEVADHLGCDPADVEQLRYEPFSDLYVTLCDAPKSEYWPSCCERPAALLTPLTPLQS